MEAIVVHLFQATDGEDSYAISREGDYRGVWRAQRGLGQKFQKVWSVEFQSKRLPSLTQIDWESVLTRAIDAYQLSDPVISDYHWPVQEAV